MEPKLYITEELKKNLEDLATAMLDENGSEWLNPVPHTLHTGVNRPLTLQEQIQRVMKVQLSEQMAAQGQESFDEANDFDVDDPFDQQLDDSKYTLMAEEEPDMTLERLKEAKEKTDNESDDDKSVVSEVDKAGASEDSEKDG